MAPSESEANTSSGQEQSPSNQGGLAQSQAQPKSAANAQQQQSSQPASSGTEDPGLFSRPDVRSLLKLVVSIYAAIGAGVGGSAFLVLTQLTDQQLLVLGGVIVPATISLMFFISPVIGAVMSMQISRRTSESGTDLYLLTGAGVFLGSVVFMAVATVILGLEVDTAGVGIQSMLVPFIAAAVPASASATGVAWCLDTLAE